MLTRQLLLALLGLLILTWVGCHARTSPGATASDGATTSDGAVSDDGGAISESGSSEAEADADAGCVVTDASVLGMMCPGACSDPGSCCAGAWTQQCLAQDGTMESCVYGGGCEGLSGTCYPPPQLDDASFRCASKACPKNVECVLHALRGDGCTSHYCGNPLPTCPDAAVCTCILASGGSSGGGASDCTQDDAGNVTVTYVY